MWVGPIYALEDHSNISWSLLFFKVIPSLSAALHRCIWCARHAFGSQVVGCRGFLDDEEHQFEHFGLALLAVSHNHVLHNSNLHGMGYSMRNRNP